MSETKVTSTLPVLTPAERQQILFDWNETSAGYPDNVTIHRWFEIQAERLPNAELVVFENQSLTYGELNRRANQLADYLNFLDVHPETPVAILAEPSLEMVISCFGVLKAGGAIVFLDATLPLERLEYILEESGATVLINSQRSLEKLPGHDLKVVCFDAHRELLEGRPLINPAIDLFPDNLAWIAYTSGTTGRPKGTLITHRTLCNLSAASNSAYGLTPELRVFDLQGLFGITMAMVCGGTAYFARRMTVLSAPRLTALLREHAINHIAIAPGMLTALSPADLPALRTITVGGETVSADVVARWSPGRRFFQNYRCTEALSGTRALCDVSDNRPLTIGRPITNTQVYILDDELEPVPVGASGELYISGVGVARGYLHRADLTAERFLPHPFSREAGQRLYRTGDLGRYRANGEIEYLGRADQQVKVRGNRIELGEIEQVLREQAGVRQAAVVVRESEQVGPQLVAYVCGEAAAVSGAEMRERVREQLPEYMVPQAVVVLDELPLLPNGKVDRRRLKELEVARAEVQQGPRTAIEELVCGIWVEVLGVEQVGVADDFFELGGHSLLATQVMSRVREVFGVEVPLSRLFEVPTVAGLSIAIVQCQAEQSESAELARLMAELEQLSDDDARVMLADEQLD
jgi:amino acid adenylation domain-containing protein